MKCFTDHCAWCAMHEEKPGLLLLYPDFFDGLTQSCKSVFFHGLSPFLARRFLQPARDSGSFVQYVLMVKRESVARTMD